MYLFSIGHYCVIVVFVFFFQAEDGIRALVRSRGLGDVYKRQRGLSRRSHRWSRIRGHAHAHADGLRGRRHDLPRPCLLYTSDAADDLPCVDLGGRRIIKKKQTRY